MYCTKRLTYKDLAVKFGDGKHRFYLETVCGSACSTEGLCTYCACLAIQTKTQDSGTFPHGLVGGPYTKESHIYDSPWYHSKLEAYGAPSSSILELAMKAKTIAGTGRKIRTIAALQADGASVSSGKPTVPIPSSDTSSAPAELLHSAPSVVGPGKQQRKKPLKKAHSEPLTTLDTSILTQLGASTTTVITKSPLQGLAETMDTPLEVKHVVQVVLKPFTHGSGTYWRDGSLEKLYKRNSDGSLGPYIGRWDSEGDCIVKDAPDSDTDS